MEYRYRDASEMKDSGVEWIGKIPKDWTVSRIDKEFNIRNEKVSDKEYPPLSVTKQGILPQLESVAKSDNGDNRKKVCVGDFVINSRADRKGSCGVSIYDGSVSLICNVLTPKKLHPQYVHSLFRNYYFSEEFYRWGSGIVDDLWSTNIEKMKKINIPIPMGEEDEKIANFLDKKTSQFDLIISKKEALIEKLEEAKKSLISEVVTGKVKVIKTDEGYDLVKRSSNEMKDSGVEWLGEIPKDWKVSKLKWYLRVKSGEFISNIKKEFGEDANIPVIGGNGVMGYSNKVNINEKVLAVGRVGALCGNVHLIDYNCWITDNSLIIYLNSSEIYLEYLLKVLKVLNLNSLSTSTAQPLITGETIKTRKFCLPTLREQKEIINFLDKKILQYESIISKNKVLIKKLKEAKQSLISEAVTGKIDILD